MLNSRARITGGRCQVGDIVLRRLRFAQPQPKRVVMKRQVVLWYEKRRSPFMMVVPNRHQPKEERRERLRGPI